MHCSARKLLISKIWTSEKRQHRKVQKDWLTSIGFPYRLGTSETIRAILSTYGIHIFFRVNNTPLQKLIMTSNPVPMQSHSNHAYKITCNYCPAENNEQLYRQLQIRISEHKKNQDQKTKLPLPDFSKSQQFHFALWLKILLLTTTTPWFINVISRCTLKAYVHNPLYRPQPKWQCRFRNFTWSTSSITDFKSPPPEH